MKEKWKGAYRIKIGKIRIIVFPNIDEDEFYIERMDFRGDVYKS